MRMALYIWALLLAMLQPAAAVDQDATQLVAALGLMESDRPLRDDPDWKKPNTIVVFVDKPSRLEWLRQGVGSVRLVPYTAPADAVEIVENADAFMGHCRPDIVHAGVKLRWIHIRTAGIDGCAEAIAASGRKILVTNMQKVAGGMIAEHAMMMALGLSHNLPAFMANQAAGRWEYSPAAKMVQLRGRSLLVVGLGGVGMEVAKQAHGMGMAVSAIRNSGRAGPDFIKRIGRPEDLVSMIGEADVVVMAAPLTPQTVGMFDAAIFARMKPTAIFINIARGASVKTEELVSALQQGRIAGAGLDVTDPEPLPQNHELWRTPNVIITPHIADGNANTSEEYWILMRENLRRYVAGEKMLSVVDVRRGY